MALGLQYYFEFKSFFGKKIKTEIWREEYEGLPIRINFGSGNPIKIEYPSNNENDVFYPIWGGNLSIDFYEQLNLGLEDIITNYERQVRIDQYVNEELYYRGWVVPDLCHDSAYRTEYLLGLTTTDAIGDLSNFPLLISTDDLALINDTSDFGYYGVEFNSSQLDTSNYENSKMTLLQIIKTCLDKADLDFGFKVINDLYETGMEHQDERVLERVLVDYLSYAQNNESKNCQEVLISIFRSFGFIVVQRNGNWNIIRIPYLLSDTISSEYYDKDGKFIDTRRENTLRILRAEDFDTKKHWHFILDEFTRERIRPYQYQNIEYSYGEALTISDYNYKNWTAKNLTVAVGTNYFEFTDNDYRYLQIAETAINAIGGSDETKRRRKNAAYQEYIKTGIFSEVIELPNYTNFTIEFTSSAKKGFFLIYADVEKFNGTFDRFYYFPNQNIWMNQSELDYSIIDLTASLIIFESKDDYNQQKERAFTIPVSLHISSLYANTANLTIICRGGTIDDGEAAELVFYRNLVVKTTQTKEVHAFTNLNKVSTKPETLTVLNGDGFSTGKTISSFLIQKETTEFPYVSKPFATKTWKDSSEQDPNNLLSFTAQKIVSHNSSDKQIVKGSMRTSRNIKLGDIISFSDFSKFAYKRFVVMPPFSYDLREDIYSLTLFEIDCSVAKGRLKEYYIDKDDVPIYKRVIDFQGTICDPNKFEWEVECQDEIFTIETVC